jgi:hypothetical protein
MVSHSLRSGIHCGVSFPSILDYPYESPANSPELQSSLFPCEHKVLHSDIPGIIVVDKTHFISLLEANPFQYMFLCPWHWGTSMFLHMLAAYYDVKTKDSFEDVFSKLEVGKALTESCNSHLILLFDFLSITPISSQAEVVQSIFNHISRTLHCFLVKYQDILGNGSLDKYIVPNSIMKSLGNVLVRILELVLSQH